MERLNAEDPHAAEGWTHRIPVGGYELPRGSGPQNVALLWQQWLDRFTAGSYEPGFGPLPQAGARTCVNAIACYWRYPPIQPARQSAFSRASAALANAAPPGLQRLDLATLYASYYPAHRVLCIGEIALHSDVVRGNGEAGTLLTGLWEAFETALRTAFPAAQELCTRAGSQDYHTPFYRSLLTGRGYAPGAHHSYRKALSFAPQPIPST